MAKRISAARVKVNRSYTVEEAAEIVGVTEPTVRDWIRRGMQAMVETRPALILGCDLKQYIRQSRTKKTGPLPVGMFFCLACKAHRAPAMGFAEYAPMSDAHGRLSAFCERCESGCSRIIRADDLPSWAATCEVGGNTPEVELQTNSEHSSPRDQTMTCEKV